MNYNISHLKLIIMNKW